MSGTEEFEAALRDLISKADISQFLASVILQDLADEQMSEFHERETS